MFLVLWGKCVVNGCMNFRKPTSSKHYLQFYSEHFGNSCERVTVLI